ncbi:MAG: zf-HC2 domain-containing protein [bacterium]|jgi:anti-sigma factor RsiW|nr:zf-HC2 domain-containing protein [bacterium]
MSCQKIKKQLLLFLDNELPEAQHQEIRQHLAGCPDCSKHLKQLTKIWDAPAAIEILEPSAHLWRRIASKLPASKNRWDLLADLWQSMRGFAVPVAATVIILIGILTGAYLGTLPSDPDSAISGQAPLVAAKEAFIKTSHLDAFDDLPPASIGGIYLSMETNQQ